MTRDDILRMAWDSGFAVTERTAEMHLHFAALVAATEREKVARFIMAQCFSTGHGDTVESMLDALVRQVAEREREACAKVCEDEGIEEIGRGDAAYNMAVQHCTSAIRARGEKP